MNRTLINSIFVSAMGLFAAISTAYLLTWYQSGDADRAHTIAFITWLAGHVGMAFNARSMRVPLFRQGLFSNNVLNMWGAGVTLFLVLIATVPAIQTITRTVPLPAQDWVLGISLAFVGAFWLEVPKWIGWARK